MSDTSKATPRPWHLAAPMGRNQSIPSDIPHIVIHGPANMQVTVTGSNQAKDAALIVQAVNSFDAMREALEILMGRMLARGLPTHENPQDKLAYEQAEKALALAEGKGDK